MSNWDFSENSATPHGDGIGGTATGPQDPWPQDEQSPDGPTGPSLAITGAPVAWLIAAVGLAALAGAAAGALGAEPVVAIAAWVLAGPVAIALVAVYSLRDTARRTQLGYSPAGWVPALYGGTIALVLAAVCICAVRIAFWAGRL